MGSPERPSGMARCRPVSPRRTVGRRGNMLSSSGTGPNEGGRPCCSRYGRRRPGGSLFGGRGTGPVKRTFRWSAQPAARAGGAPRRRPRTGTGTASGSTAGRRCPIPRAAPAAGGPRRARARSSTTTRFALAASRGRAARCPARSSTSCTSGTYTPEGTFDAAAARLRHLADLGITHVELMPVCPFPGTPRLGVRRGRAVGGARAVRRARRAEAVRGRGARARPRRRPRRGAQPPRPVRQPSPGVRAVLHRHPSHAVGRRGQSRRPRLRRGARLPPRQRARLAARLPARRAAAGRRARAARRPRARTSWPNCPPPSTRWPAQLRPPAVPDRRVRPQRPAHHRAARRTADTVCTPSGTTTSTTPCTPRSPANPRAITPTSHAPRSPPSPRR